MTPEEYFRKIIELYHDSRQPKYYNPNIKRGRSSSISSELEDLTALFIALNNPNVCSYYTDQPIKFEGSTTKYPDIVIQNQSGVIQNLVDVKTDIGWNRNGMFAFCKEWEKRIESVKGTNTEFREGDTKIWNQGRFSRRLKYHVMIVTNKNSGKSLEKDYIKVKEQFRNIRLYILSEGLHPNNYKFSLPETMSRIQINHREFDRFFSCINKR